MNILIRQISSLEKVRDHNEIPEVEVQKKMLLGGEEFSYQIVLYSNKELFKWDVRVESSLQEYVRLYAVENAVMDMPCYPNGADDDYMTEEPGMMPDVLVPLEHYKGHARCSNGIFTLWVSVLVPEGYSPGEYPIDLVFSGERSFTQDSLSIKKRMSITVLGADMPKQKTIFTQWFHVDCIARMHQVPIYSEAHWTLIHRYMKLARELGINMILTPVITPPLDTAVGSVRPCTQLVRIEKNGTEYQFDFALLKRWIGLCKAVEMEYYEISHLFSQWGLQCAPNIMVTENGEASYLFGWHVPAKDTSYKTFLQQFIPTLVQVLKEEGIFEKCYFHISDEPGLASLEDYRYAHDLVAPMLEGAHLMDALSNLDFYESGLVSVPVTSTRHLGPFLEKQIDHQWAYYCCGERTEVGNRFLAMPSYRNRILGLQLYKYNIEGFLQWGYNYYNTGVSEYEINPYLTTSGDKCYPSGDPFSVYPYKDGAIPSLRAVVFKEALQEIGLCKLLEGYIGREAVVKFIDKEAGMNLTFKEYPRNSSFLPSINDKMKQMIQDILQK